MLVATMARAVEHETLPVRGSFRECALEQARHRLRGKRGRAGGRAGRGAGPRRQGGCRGAGLCRADRHQLLAFPQRHHAVADRLGLSDPEGCLRAGLRADRHDHAGVPVHRLAAAARGRAFHRQEGAAVLACDRHGIYVLRLAAAQRRAALSRHPDRGRAGRPRLGGVSSGVRRGSRGSPRAGVTVLRNRCFSSAAVSARRWGRCWRR